LTTAGHDIYSLNSIEGASSTQPVADANDTSSIGTDLAPCRIAHHFSESGLKKKKGKKMGKNDSARTGAGLW
jgi:hypothetical protein